MHAVSDLQRARAAVSTALANVVTELQPQKLHDAALHADRKSPQLTD